ncbi:uncharacterized protein METZ01_LOCUS141814 [marine metagenome]|uniref:Uncharacterized protein n=1 Tax=marine metagenome TaxID=408172 RepID=A0A381ZI86_9ZZZZ
MRSVQERNMLKGRLCILIFQQLIENICTVNSLKEKVSSTRALGNNGYYSLIHEIVLSY